jgi:hypothetical protein
VPNPHNQQQQDPAIAPINNPQVNNVSVAQAQTVQGTNGGIVLKVEQTKIPEFWGQKDKDSITAAEFVKLIDKMMSANSWSDKITFHNFALAIRGSANVWLDSKITLDKIKADCKCWTLIWPLFKAEFMVESDDKLILDRLAHLAMKNTENVRDYFSHLNKTNRIILDTKKSYPLIPENWLWTMTARLTSLL